MSSNFSISSQSDLTIIGIYQLLGGVTGIAVTCVSLANRNNYTEALLFFYLVFFLFFLYSVFCGWLCVRWHKAAFIFSLVNQYMQLVSFSIAGFSYTYIAGMYLSWGADVTSSFRPGFDVGLSNVQIFLNSGSKSILFSFNFVACMFIYWLSRLKKHTELEKEIQETDSIGETEDAGVS